MAEVFCEVCRNAPATHWTAIVCEPCADWLERNDTDKWPIWDWRHSYHGYDPDAWLDEIRSLYQRCNHGEKEIATTSSIPPFLGIPARLEGKAKAEARAAFRKGQGREEAKEQG